MLQTDLKDHPSYFKFLVLLVCILFAPVATSQQKELDSLYTLLKTSTNDTILAETHGRIGWLSINFNSNLAKAHLDSSKTLFVSLKDESNVARTDYRRSVLFRRQGDFVKAEENMKAFKNYMIRAKDTFNIANAHFQMGSIYSGFSDYDKALNSYTDALTLFEKLQDSTGQGFVLNSIANVYKNSNRLAKAKALYINKILPIHKAKNDMPRLANAIYGLASVYHEMGQLDSSLIYHHKAIAIDLKENIRWGLAINYTDVANIYREKENRDSSKIYLKKAYIIQKEENLESDLMLTLASLTLLDTESNNLDSAQNYLNEAFSLQSDTKKGKREVYRVAYILNRKKGNTKKALEYHELFVTTKDSILNDVTQKNLNETLAKYETEKKEREIAEQEVIIKQQELDLSNKQRQIAIWGGLGGILILLLGASLWTGKERQKRKEQEIVSIKSQQEVVRLESLVAGEEKERIRLAQDLHDGINGDLSVIKFKIDGVDKKQMSETTTEGLNQAMHMLDNAIDQVRRISHNLAPPSLQNFNLTEAIKQYASKMQSTHGIQIDFQTFGKMPSFTSDQETALYRIVQELLNNIIKHAEAKETLIQLNYTDEHTELVIEDDGKGFDTKISKNGIGLQNIASRVAFLKGNLNIESSGEGSTFTITLPKIS